MLISKQSQTLADNLRNPHNLALQSCSDAAELDSKDVCLLTLFPSRLRVSSAVHLVTEHKFRYRSRCQSHLVITTTSTHSWTIVVAFCMLPWICCQLHFHEVPAIRYAGIYHYGGIWILLFKRAPAKKCVLNSPVRLRLLIGEALRVPPPVIMWWWDDEW